MLTSDEFLAEPRYDTLIIQAPNDIESRHRCEIRVGNDMYSAYGNNGLQALIAAIRRFRDTDPDVPGSQTLTISVDRGHHRKD